MDGIYSMYFPFSPMIEEGKEGRYHKKLLENTEFLTHLHERLNATVELLNGVAC